MTSKDCEPRIMAVKQRFCKHFNCEFDVAVVLLSESDIQETRELYFKLCSVPPYEFHSTTSGETIYGFTEQLVLMYPFNCKYPADFDLSLCHEFGHVFFIQENRELYLKLSNLENMWVEGNIARNGLKLWSEFIAHSIANWVMDPKPAKIAFQKQDELIRLLENALPALTQPQNLWERLCEDGIVNSYVLGLYCAMYLTDPTIADLLENMPEASTGLDGYDEDVMNSIIDILRMLDKKLAEENFWIVDEPWLKELGILIMNLEKAVQKAS